MLPHVSKNKAKHDHANANHTLSDKTPQDITVRFLKNLSLATVKKFVIF